MLIKKLKKEDLEVTLKMLKDDNLRYADGKHPDKYWVENLITNRRCLAFGLWDDEELSAIILAEKLTFDGCIIWYMATEKTKRNSGLGSQLLQYFEKFTKIKGLKWIFLNATGESLNFYKKHKFKTSKYSTVFEHIKDF